MMLDVYRGAVWGDFDQDLGVAGAAAQSTIGFIPVAGSRVSANVTPSA
jgi:hypothetical protein